MCGGGGGGGVVVVVVEFANESVKRQSACHMFLTLKSLSAAKCRYKQGANDAVMVRM